MARTIRKYPGSLVRSRQVESASDDEQPYRSDLARRETHFLEALRARQTGTSSSRACAWTGSARNHCRWVTHPVPPQEQLSAGVSERSL